MPTYQYACTTPDCAERFERVQSFTDPAVTECPVCGGPVRKVYSSVGVVFKGSGFYRNDSRAEAKSANGSGKGESGKTDSGSGEAKSGGEKAAKTESGSGGKDSSASASSSATSGSSSTSGSAASSSSTSSAPASKS